MKKPKLRGWSHAVTVFFSVGFTYLLYTRSRHDFGLMVSLMIFGLSMVELYTMSAVYHIGNWPEKTRKRLRLIDHSNIFILIAGTYTPISYVLLQGSERLAILVTIWTLALLGLVSTFFLDKIPRWINPVLYVGMGWVVIFVLPTIYGTLSWQPVATLIAGGALYTIGAIIYALKRPNPWPNYFGFHEIFHLFVIAGSAAFASLIWIWVIPHAG